MASETAAPNPGAASAVGKGSVPSAPVALAPSLVESKRTKLIHSIEVARDAGASHAIISALQADLVSLLEPKVGQDEMDQDRLLQLRAKQQAHHQSELDTLNSTRNCLQFNCRSRSSLPRLHSCRKLRRRWRANTNPTWQQSTRQSPRSTRCLLPTRPGMDLVKRT